MKKEEGNNNTQKEGVRRFERNGDVHTIKIMGPIVMKSGKGMRDMQGEVLSLPPTRLHNVDNRYRKSPPNT